MIVILIFNENNLKYLDCYCLKNCIQDDVCIMYKDSLS